MSDSVGKISLDLEVQSDLQNQINNVSNNIAKNIKSNLEGATKGIFNGLETGIKKSTDKVSKTVSGSMDNIKKNIKNTFSSLKDIKIQSPKIDFNLPNQQPIKQTAIKSVSETRGPPGGNNINLNQLSAQIGNTEKTLDNINARIENQKAKLSQLSESYRNTFNPNTKNKIQEQMLKTEASINRLIGQSDKLGFKLSDLDSKFSALKSVQNSTANTSNATSKSINSVANTLSKVGQNSKDSTSILEKLNGIFRNTRNSSNAVGNGFRNANNGLTMFMGSMFKWGIVFPIIQKSIMGMASFVGVAFMSNVQFANSLDLIRSNLYTAFAPIYTAILPAINTLMSALAKLSAYIASFVNNLFGQSYDAGFNAAKNLQSSIGAYEQQEKAAKKAATSLGSAGKAAKKAGSDAKSALANFDEINTLNNSNKVPSNGTPAGSGVVTPITPMPNMAPIEAKTQEWADNFKMLMSELMKPIFGAWENEGQNTINSIKYSLSSVLNLINSISSSFKDVWLNGTGQETCEVILQIFQNIFNIIGDISSALDKAWNKNNIGTKIIQNIWSSFNNVLKIIRDIGISFRNVFSNIGESVTDHLMGILESLSQVMLHLTEKLKSVWDNGGKYCFEQILEFAGRVINILSDIITNSLAPMAEFIIDTLSPVIEFVLNMIGYIFEKLNDFLSWLDSDGNGILTGIIDTLLAFGAAWQVVKIGIAIFDALQVVMGVVSGAAGVLSAAIAFLTSPLGLVALAIGSVILIGYELYKHWDDLAAKAGEAWSAIQQSFQNFDNWLNEVFSTDWSNRFGFFGDIMNGFLNTARNIWDAAKGVFSGIIDFVAGVFTGDWSRAWNGVSNVFRNIFNGLSSFVKFPMNAVISVINGAISGINSISIDIPKGIPGVGGMHFGPHISKIPYLAKGGVVDQPTLAMFGEAGKEAVVPLENNTGWIDNVADKIASKIPRNSENNNSGKQLVVNIYQNGVLTVTKVIDDINTMTEANGGVCPINI